MAQGSQHSQHLLSPATEERASMLLSQSSAASRSRHSFRNSRFSESTRSNFRSSGMSSFSAVSRSSFGGGSIIGDRVDTELYESRKRLQAAETALCQANAEHELQVAELTQWKEDCERNWKESLDKIEKLEKDRRFLFEREAKSAAKVQELEDKYRHLEKQANNRIDTLREQLEELQGEHADMLDRHREAEAQWRHKDAMYKSTVVDLSNTEYGRQHEITEMSAEIVDLKKRLAQAEGEAVSVRAQYTLQQSTAAVGEDVASLLAQLKDQTDYVRDLEFKNNALNKRVQRYEATQRNIMLVEEEKRALEQRFAKLDGLEKQLVSVELENKLLKSERAEWASYVSDFGVIGFSTPHDMARALASDRIELASLRESKARLEANAVFQTETMAQLESQVAALKKTARQLQDDVQAEKFQFRRAQQSKQLLEQEVALLKAQLDSFEQEYQSTTPELIDAQYTRKVQDMDQLLSSYKAQIQHLSDDAALRATGTPPEQPLHPDDSFAARYARELQEKQHDIERLSQEQALLIKEVEMLRTKNELLEQAVTASRQESTTTAAAAAAVTDAIQLSSDVEVQDVTERGTKRRRLDVEDSTDAGSDTDSYTTTSERQHMHDEIRKLEHELVDQTHQQEDTAEQLENLQAAVSAILGYDIVPLPDHQYDVRSVYAYEDEGPTTFEVDVRRKRARAVHHGPWFYKYGGGEVSPDDKRGLHEIMADRTLRQARDWPDDASEEEYNYGMASSDHEQDASSLDAYLQPEELDLDDDDDAEGEV
ncbi:coiled-coil domain-containing protein mad1 [Sorochytrium milnesiophthora]